MHVSTFSVPVVITSDRLRSSRIGDNDKPLTSNKNENQEENTNKLKKVCRNSTTTTATTSKTTSNSDNSAREKLYPKRERTKTAKFEEFFTGFTKKGQLEEQKLETAPDSSKAAETKEDTTNNADSTENEMKMNEKADKMDDSLKGEPDENNEQSIIQDNICGVVTSSSSSTSPSTEAVKDQQKVSELTGTTLTKDITIEIEIIRDPSNKTPPSSLLESIKQSSESSDSCESVIEDGERLELIRIPKRMRGLIRQQQQQQQPEDNPEIDDDIPLSRIFNTGINGPLRLSEDGNKVKRPVGRPRKHPIIVNKVKRPVGRPRKEPADKTANPQQKRKRGRPPSLFVPSQYYGAYTQSSFFEVEDDDERDPVSISFLCLLFMKLQYSTVLIFFLESLKCIL